MAKKGEPSSTVEQDFKAEQKGGLPHSVLDQKIKLSIFQSYAKASMRYRIFFMAILT